MPTKPSPAGGPPPPPAHLDIWLPTGKFRLRERRWLGPVLEQQEGRATKVNRHAASYHPSNYDHETRWIRAPAGTLVMLSDLIRPDNGWGSSST